MKQLLPLAILFISFSSLHSQNARYTDLDFSKTDSIKTAYVPENGANVIFIASKFGSSDVLKGFQLDSISSFLIKKIVLVYSAFHKADKFNQAQLNEARWTNFIASYPDFFSNGITRYQEICQYGVNTDTLAHKLTHGFYIYFENRSDPVKRDMEINEINKMLGKLGISPSDTLNDESSTDLKETESKDNVGSATISSKDLKKSKAPKFMRPARAKDPKACRRPFYETGGGELNELFESIMLSKKQKRKPKKLQAYVKLRIEYNGLIKGATISGPNKKFNQQVSRALFEMNPWNPAVRNGVTIKSEVKFAVAYQNGKIVTVGDLEVSKNVAKCGIVFDEDMFDLTKTKVKEKLIPEVFEAKDGEILRNVIERNPDMDSLLVAVDLTGSMGPYIAQVLDLMADLVVNNDPHVSCFSLFNDGNNTPDKKKKTGNTGGIIIVNEEVTLDKLGKAIVKSMKNGGGGDCPENNVEAVLKGLEECNTCKDIVMIADNWATPRDGILLSKVNKPIHWIICGVFGEINCDYLDLVRRNKGFLHTSKSDVRNLHLLKEEETILIDGFTYKLSKNKFKCITVS